MYLRVIAQCHALLRRHAHIPIVTILLRVVPYTSCDSKRYSLPSLITIHRWPHMVQLGFLTLIETRTLASDDSLYVNCCIFSSYLTYYCSVWTATYVLGMICFCALAVKSQMYKLQNVMSAVSCEKRMTRRCSKMLRQIG